MKTFALVLLLGGASLGAAAPGEGWLGAPSPSQPAEPAPEAPTPGPGAEAKESPDPPTLAARRVLDVMRRWPGPQMIEGRRMELVWVAHDLEAAGEIRAAGIVRRFLRRYGRSHCDRRDEDQEAASAQLSPERVQDLREHLDAWHRTFFTRDAPRPEGSTEVGIFRGVPICRYRM